MQEWDDVRDTIAKDADIIGQHLCSLTNLTHELSGLHDNVMKLCEDKTELSGKILKLQSNVADLEKQLGDITEERDKAFQDVENLQDITDAIMQQISQLEARLEAPHDPGTPNKCQQST
ncbi:unnamed protein product [Calypogeia fissa]